MINSFSDKKAQEDFRERRKRVAGEDDIFKEENKIKHPTSEHNHCSLKKFLYPFKLEFLNHEIEIIKSKK